MRSLRSIKACVLASSVAAVFAGCGNNVLDPEVTGGVDPIVRDSPQAAVLSGTAAGDMSVSIRSAGGSWVEIGAPNGITVNLQSAAGSSVHGSQDIPAGTYDRVRLTMSQIQVKVSQGSVIGGTTLDIERSTMIAPSEALVVERALSALSVREGSTIQIVFELNSAAWLDLVALDSGEVDDSAVEASVTASAAAS